MPEATDYYKTLGVEEDASADDIKKSFRRLARRYHPDRNPDREDAEERFKDIQEAYATLSDPEKRKEYDIRRRNPFGEGFQGNGGERVYRSPDGSYVRYDTGGENPFGDIFGESAGADDFFSRVFRGGGGDPDPRRQSRRARDINTRLHLTFERALEGGRTEVTLPSGEKVRINIPKGVADGFKIRLRGRGEKGSLGDSGDLYVKFEVESHEEFRREDDNLYFPLEVSIFEAIFGAQRSIRTAYGKRIKVSIPPGTQPGHHLRIKEQGVATESRTGDLYVEIRVAIPRDLTEDQKVILKEAAQKANLL